MYRRATYIRGDKISRIARILVLGAGAYTASDNALRLKSGQAMGQIFEDKPKCYWFWYLCKKILRINIFEVA